MHTDARTFRIICGDSLDVLATLPEASFDAIVTDPPYGIEFAGRAWDKCVPGVDYWRAAARVLKPGAHLLAFGGTRTYHRLGVAIEDAGFEIRDSLAWLYGSGFLKSLDVSKAIDRQRHDRDQVLTVTRWIRERRDAAGMTNAQIDEAFGFHGMAGHWTTQGSQPAIPTLDQWPHLMAVLDVDEVPEEIQLLAVDLNGAKGTPGKAWFEREVIGEARHGTKDRTAVGAGTKPTLKSTFAITAPASDAARRWKGWGTTLKPAFEPIILARLPLMGTVANNVTTYGTGALNVDGCRIGAESTDATAEKGRWPSNVLLDESAAEMLDEQAGERASGSRKGGIYSNGSFTTGGDGCGLLPTINGSTGGASRFFYTSKASRTERQIGREYAEFDDGHPTVKPADLMAWLMRLVAPPGARVLDPFAGSGSTGIAALREGCSFVGIERDPSHAQAARARIKGDAPILNVEVEP